MGDADEAKASLGGVLDAIPDAIAVQSGDRFVYVAEDLADVTGSASEELVGAHWETVVAPSEREDHEPGGRTARDGRESDGPTPVDVARADGSWTGPLLADASDENSRRAVTLTATDDGDLLWRRSDDASAPTPTANAVAADGDTADADRAKHIFDTVLDGVYALDGNLEFTFVNEALARLFDVPQSELLGMDVREVFANEEAVAVAREIRQRVIESDSSNGSIKADVETSEGTRTLESNYRLYPEPDGEFRGSVGVIRDVTDHEQRERELKRHRDELATLDRINELLLETTRELVESASRDAVERRVCERLATSDRYAFAWVGEQAFDGDRIVPRASAGDGRGYLDDVTVTRDESETGSGPGGRAMRTGEVQVANVSDPAFDQWRAAASERGFGSTAAVPLRHGDTVYGVLVVYATEEDAFTDREQAGFDVLGRTVGFVIHASKNRKLLDADAVVEVEFQYEDADAVSPRLSERLDCRLELDGYVASGNQWVLYSTVEGVSPAVVVEAAEADAGVSRATVVTDDADRKRVELTLSESSFLDTISDAGAELTRSFAENGAGRLAIEFPVSADARSITALVQREYPTLELVAQRERDRSTIETGPPKGLLAALTDRQRQSLEAAHHAGYFRWPRERTAEEVAESLDIAAPTFHGHVRKAERSLFSQLFDTERRK